MNLIKSNGFDILTMSLFKNNFFYFVGEVLIPIEQSGNLNSILFLIKEYKNNKNGFSFFLNEAGLDFRVKNWAGKNPCVPKHIAKMKAYNNINIEYQKYLKLRNFV